MIKGRSFASQAALRVIVTKVWEIKSALWTVLAVVLGIRSAEK